MRMALVVILVVAAGAMLLPVAESQSLPLDGVKLVAETRTPMAELAAGKNGNKSGNGGNHNGNKGTFGSAAVVKGGFGTFFVNRGLSAPTDGELVAVEIR